MGRKSRVGGVHYGPVADRSEHTRRGTQMTVTTKHMLLTGSWKKDVEASETAIGRFTADRPAYERLSGAVFRDRQRRTSSWQRDA